MADHTYEELRKKTVAELREIAKNLEHDAVKGYSQLNKEHLLPAVCQALGLDAYEHHHVVGGSTRARSRPRCGPSRLTDKSRLRRTTTPSCRRCGVSCIG